jgi:glycosyltransferase involved in cell wall biosynthesis
VCPRKYFSKPRQVGVGLKVLVTLEHRFQRTPDGAVWTQTGFPYAFWTIYLDVFDQVRVVARVRDVAVSRPGWQRADGDRVAFAAVPYFIGPGQYLRRLWRIKRAIRSALAPDDAVILQLSSTVAACLEPALRRTGHPYGVEVVGDPYDVFSPGANPHPLRPFCRWLFPRQLRRQCVQACAAAYVTEKALQRRYPPGPGAFTTHYSNIVLQDDDLVAIPRPIGPAPVPFTLITVGMLEHFYKAPDILIEAVGLCRQQGLAVRLVLVGDGRRRPDLEARAAKSGLGENVRFLGQLTAGAAVRAQLDRADLFVLPSRQEGLPRAMVEAMARALPCIGSTVGGIPELLPSEDLVPPGDAMALAEKIRALAADPMGLAFRSARNLLKARDYHNDILRGRRMAFYRHVQEKTANWLKTQNLRP